MWLRIFFCLVVVSLRLTLGIAQRDLDAKRKYIEQYRWVALREMERTGIPAAIKLAQGLLESNAGSSTLATEANNHFGLKCHNDWTGDTFYKIDDDRNSQGQLIPSCFRKFRSAEESYLAHSLWLTQKPRYSSLFLLDPSDYQGWAHGLRKAGYATDPSYGQKLIAIIEQFHLDAILPPPVSSEPAISLKVETTVRKETLQKESKLAVAVADEQRDGVWIMNRVRFVYSMPGLTLDVLSRETGVPLKKLKQYNAGLAVEILQQGRPTQQLFLEPKRRAFRGRQHWHEVQSGESIRGIADYYAIQEEPLRWRNRLQSTEEPTIGFRLKLKGSKIKVSSSGK